MKRRRRASSLAASFGFVTLVLALAGMVVLRAASGLDLLWSWLIAVSAVTFVTFMYDKSIAGSGRTRVPERVLLGLALVGGTLGAASGMVLLRHKTSKRSFWGRLVLIALAQGALAAALYAVR